MATFPDFLNVVFPKDISYGAQSSSRFKTDITMVESGFEKRNANWQDSLHEFNVSHNIKTEDQAILLKKLYQQMRGPLISFKFKDWTDFKCDHNFEGIGNEDGKFTGMPWVELWKKYEFTTDFDYYARRIKLIMDDNEVDYLPFACYINNVIQNPVNYVVDKINGRVNLPAQKQINITSVSKATNAIVVTSVPHTFLNGSKIYLTDVVNASIVNNRLFTITVIDATSFYLNFDTTSLVVNGSSGKASFYQQDTAVFTWQGEFYVNVRFSEDIATLSIDDYRSFSFPCKLTEIRS